MTNTGFAEGKGILGGEPIGVQLRHIENLSWIGNRILEIIVDVRHAQKMSNRITNHSSFTVKSRFDPLCPEWFDWDGDILPESKIRILQTKFVMRLACSMASSRQASSREYTFDWVRKRGLGQQLEKRLKRDGIILPSSVSMSGPSLSSSNNPPPATTACTPARAPAPASATSSPSEEEEEEEAATVTSPSKRNTSPIIDEMQSAKRKRTISSSFNDSFDR